MFLDEEGESQWHEHRFELMWVEHGGSGLGMTFSEVNDLDVAEIKWLVERQRQQRHDEAEAIKRAGRKR